MISAKKAKQESDDQLKRVEQKIKAAMKKGNYTTSHQLDNIEDVKRLRRLGYSVRQIHYLRYNHDNDLIGSRNKFNGVYRISWDNAK